MTLLRMLVFRPAGTSTTSTERVPVAKTTAVPAAAPARSVAPAPGNPPASAGGWSEIVAQLGVTALVRELAVNSQLDVLEGDRIGLTLDQAFAHLLNKEREAALGQALSAHFGRALQLRIAVGQPAETPAREKQRNQQERQQAATEAILSDPAVRLLQDEFNARVNPASIQAKD
jgi:DNA polymerase-3 subunit gamma/tau